MFRIDEKHYSKYVNIYKHLQILKFPVKTGIFSEVLFSM